MEEVERKLGPVSILVNNAGISIMRSALKFRAEDWDRVIETNLNSCFFLSQIAAQSMVARKQRQDNQYRERVLALRLARVGIPIRRRRARWCRLTKTMAIELAPHNIQVNAIVPGMDRDRHDDGRAERTPFYDEIIMRTPAGRFGKPEEMAGAAVFLASHASDFVTGSIGLRRRRLRDSVAMPSNACGLA